MSMKIDPTEKQVVQKKLNKIKEKYSIKDFRSDSYWCNNLLFYVNDTNQFYGIDLPYSYDDFLRSGGMSMVCIENVQEFSKIKTNRWNRAKLLFDENDLNEFKRNNPWSGVENFSFTHLRHRYIDDVKSQLMYAVCYTENPQIEKMMKTGLRSLVEKWILEPSVLYKRSFKNGKNLNEITKLPKYAWQMMASESLLTGDINAWNEMRVWVQKDNLTKEQLRTILNFNLYDTKTLKDLRGILSAEHNGKRIFNIDTLLNYLERVDMHQAISPRESIPILNDYIRMCRSLNILPLTDSNSLKREHDVTVRQYNEQKHFEKDKEYTEKFKKRYSELTKYEYSDGRLIVIVPKTPEDMRKEGRENRNCVGSYTSLYADGKSNVMFIRKCDTPENSYITAELSEDFTSTRQAFYSSNRRITNEQDLKFIESWLKHNRNVNLRLEKEPDIEEIEINGSVKESLTDKIKRGERRRDENINDFDITQGDQHCIIDINTGLNK